MTSERGHGLKEEIKFEIIKLLNSEDEKFQATEKGKEQKSEGTTYNTMHLALATINVRMLQTNSIRKSN